MVRTVSFEDFQATRYFPVLDGLRTLSILLVISLHSTDPLWAPLRGNVGVTVFFVISGFLITTLLLREETERGAASIRAFYIRRAFRILPVYYLALGGYALLIGALEIKTGAGDLWRALPYYLTYQNDFSPKGSGFGHSWSLAVEEKFYLLWPLTFSILALRRHRLAITIGLIAATSVASVLPWGWSHYLAVYAPILCGCLLAQLMHHRASYEVVRRLARTPVLLVVLAAIVVQTAMFEDGGNVHVVFGMLTTLAMPGLVIGPAWVAPVLANRVALHIGTRSYAVYLIHRMAKGIVDRVLPPGGSNGEQVIRLVLIVLLALAAAEVIYRVLERPMIQWGRQLARLRDAPALTPAAQTS